jgi:hypothetical protein
MAPSRFTPVRIGLPLLVPAVLLALVWGEVIVMETAMALGTSLTLLVMFGIQPMLARLPGVREHEDWLWIRCAPQDTVRLAGALVRLHPSTREVSPRRVRIADSGAVVGLQMPDGTLYAPDGPVHPALPVLNHRANRPRIVAAGPVSLPVATLEAPPDDDLSFQEMAARHAEDRAIVAAACRRAGVDPAPWLD